MNKDIFVCSPLRGDIEGNTKKAEQYCRYVTLLGHNPFAPHLFYTRFLDEHSELERKMGIALGMQRLRKCDEVWVFADCFLHCSAGMMAEINEAHLYGIPVKYMGTIADA
jgi:hypothetical protein